MKIKKPNWCEHSDCTCVRKTRSGTICAGILPEPIQHNNGFDIYRICGHNITFNRKKFINSKKLNSKDALEDTIEHLFNDTDMEWLEWLVDGLQRAYKKLKKEAKI